VAALYDPDEGYESLLRSAVHRHKLADKLANEHGGKWDISTNGEGEDQDVTIECLEHGSPGGVDVDAMPDDVMLDNADGVDGTADDATDAVNTTVEQVTIPATYEDCDPDILTWCHSDPDKPCPLNGADIAFLRKQGVKTGPSRLRDRDHCKLVAGQLNDMLPDGDPGGYIVRWSAKLNKPTLTYVLPQTTQTTQPQEQQPMAEKLESFPFDPREMQPMELTKPTRGKKREYVKWAEDEDGKLTIVAKCDPQPKCLANGSQCDHDHAEEIAHSIAKVGQHMPVHYRVDPTKNCILTEGRHRLLALIMIGRNPQVFGFADAAAVKKAIPGLWVLQGSAKNAVDGIVETLTAAATTASLSLMDVVKAVTDLTTVHELSNAEVVGRIAPIAKSALKQGVLETEVGKLCTIGRCSQFVHNCARTAEWKKFNLFTLARWIDTLRDAPDAEKQIDEMAGKLFEKTISFAELAELTKGKKRAKGKVLKVTPAEFVKSFNTLSKASPMWKMVAGFRNGVVPDDEMRQVYVKLDKLIVERVNDTGLNPFRDLPHVIALFDEEPKSA
jgi:hypothetical protein